MFELTAADRSLLSWIHQTGIPARSLSIRFHLNNLIIHCQSIEDATQLWEKRSILEMTGIELCFRVNGTFYIGAKLG